MSNENKDISLYNNHIKEYLEIISELDINDVPSRYVDMIVINFDDGSKLELYEDDFRVENSKESNIPWKEIRSMFKNIKSMNMQLNIFTIEEDLEERLEELYGGMIDVF